MAPKTESKKRKINVEGTASTKKARRSGETAEANIKNSSDTANSKTTTIATKSEGQGKTRGARKRAVESLEPGSASRGVAAIKNSKHVKTANIIDEGLEVKEVAKEQITKVSNPESELNGDTEEDVDHTTALLEGFESSEEESDTLEAGVAIDALPKLSKDKKLRKQLENAKGSNKPGVVFVGRVPHGFYEHQMRAYFSQFGDILNLRLSRNRKTGRSKHYAFIEFQSDDVARIVAGTMDKYLLFGHILQVRYIPREQVHEQLFKNANRRFKTMPRNKIEGKALAVGAGREVWEKRIRVEERRRKAKVDRLKGLGYEFDAPSLREVKDVPAKPNAIETTTVQEATSLQVEGGDSVSKTTETSLDGKNGSITVTEKSVVEKAVTPESKDLKSAEPKSADKTDRSKEKSRKVSKRRSK